MGKRQAAPAPPEDRFVLHRFNGDEVYRFKSAIMFTYSADPVTRSFEVQADREAISRCEDTAELGMAPGAAVDIELPNFDLDQLVGRTFSIPGTKTDDEDSCKALFSYCEHEPLRKNKITVVSRKGDRFWLRWTAETKDVNFYDGSKPPTKVEIEGEFLFVTDVKKWFAEH
jgi:hypothetical protein